MTNVLYTPFLNATKDVFQLMLDLHNITDKPHRIDEVGHSNSNMDIAIGIIGDLEGKVVYHFPTETSLEMVKIMSGMEFDEIDDFVTSAMGEIANIISGNVMSILSTQDFTCDILPPQIITPDNESQETGSFDFLSGMQICTDIGDINLDIMLKTKPTALR